MAPATIRNATNILMELRKICQHPYFSAPEMEDLSLSDERQQKELVQSSGKLAFLKILLPKLKAKGHRVLLFSQFKIALDRLQDFLYGEGYAFLRLDGDAPQAQRQKDMDAFNAPGSEIFIFLLTTRAGGVGINLASADTVIVYDPDFNPHQDLQAIARSHRYGQNKKVLVFKLITKDSVEEQIIQNGKRKMVLDHLVVQNLGKDGGDDGEIDTMLLHGARALYETNDDGTSSTDVTYSSRQVDEMIEKVERQADEEAQLLKEKWDKEDSMTEEEKREAMANRSSVTMDFSFAKIWETERGDLAEIEEEEGEMDDDRVDADLEDELRIVQENAQKAREKQLAEDMERDRKDRRKKVVYTVEENLTPRKKKAGRKSKGKEKMVDGEDQSSDSEFQVDAQDASDEEEDDDAIALDAIPENIRELLDKNEHAALFAGLGKKKSELSKLERKAMMKKFAEMAAQSTREHNLIVEGPFTKDGIPPSLFLNPDQKISKHPGETPEQRAIRKAEKKERRRLARVLEMEAQMQQAIAASMAPGDQPSAPGPSTRPAVTPAQPVAGPSTFTRNPSPPKSTLARNPSPPKSTFARNPSPPKRISPTPPLVDAARQAVINQNIVHGQAAIDRLWHEIERFGRHELKQHWGAMALPQPHRSFPERMGLYWGLATAIDSLRASVGEPRYFTEPSIRPHLEVLFNQSAPGVSETARPARARSRANGHHIAAPAVNNQGTHRPAEHQANGSRDPQSQAQPQAVAGPPTNVTRPELRPQPSPKRAIHLKSSIRPANIATPAAAPPRATGLNPPRPTSIAAPRPVRPLPDVGKYNSSQISPVNNAEPLFLPNSASTGPTSTAPATHRSGSRSVPPSNTSSHRPNRSASPSVQPTHLNGHAPTNGQPQAGPSRPSTDTATIIHPPPALYPSYQAPQSNGQAQQFILPPCEICQQTKHTTRHCPDRSTQERLIRYRRVVIAALSDNQLSPAMHRVHTEHLREMDRRLTIFQRLAQEDAQNGRVGLAQHPPPWPLQSTDGMGHPAAVMPTPQAPPPPPMLAPVITGPEGRSKDTAIAIDDDDDMAGPSVQPSSQPLPQSALTQAAPRVAATNGHVNTHPVPIVPDPVQMNGTSEIPTAAEDSCKLCRQPDLHPLWQCPWIVNQPDKVRKAVAQLKDSNPLKAKVQEALELYDEDNRCAMCGKVQCQLDVRECAERRGGRAVLKNRIRKLDAEREEAGLEATPVLRKLYDCYSAWPREEEGSARKKIKREQ